MRQPESLEINLWNTLENAAKTPEEIDLGQLWQILENTIGELDSTEKLRVAAEAIAQITTVFQERSSLIFEDLQASTNGEPTLPDDAFDRYVRQSTIVDFEPFIEPLPGLPRKPTDRSLSTFAEEDSIAGIVEKAALLQALDQLALDQLAFDQPTFDPQASFEQAIAIAHDEEVSVWAAMIQAYLTRQTGDRVCLEELRQALPLSLIEIWLGLLLGGYSLRGIAATPLMRSERSQPEPQRGYFYPTEIWIDSSLDSSRYSEE
jgi:hypothetical protein